MIIKRTLRYIGLVLLLSVTVLSYAAVPLSASGGGVTVSDYGMPDSERNTAVEGSELLKLLLGADVGIAEAEYINQSGLYKFVYNDTVPAKSVTAKMTDEGLLVTLRTWEYTAQNGQTVSWVPSSVTVNGVTKSVDGAGDCLYEGSFADTKSFEISAKYEAEFSIDKELYNSLINFAYRDASAKNKELLEYDEKKAAYDASVNAYEQYKTDLVNFNSELKLYNAYLRELNNYEIRLKGYNDYLEKLAEYTAQKEAYDAYVEAMKAYETEFALYKAYTDAKYEYNNQATSYKNYLILTESRLKKLEVMSLIFARNSDENSLYASLFGDTVDTVVAKKSDVVGATGVEPEAVDIAGESTENLRRIIGEYEDIVTDREKYLFYEQHYGELCENFNTLLEMLRTFYGSPTVRGILNANGKLQRYREFLAQLYVITTSLDDTLKRDDDWKLYEEGVDYSIDSLLESAHKLPDNQNSNPQNAPGWPDEVTDPGEPPQKVEQPKKPDEVNPPRQEPNPYAEPTAPEEVKEPVMPTEPPKPGAMPEEVGITAAERAIVAALRAGEIKKRAESATDIVIKKTETVTQTRGDLNNHYVRFINGKDVVWEYEIDDGEKLKIPSDIPLKSETSEFKYSFNGWKDENGETAAESPVYSDLEYYASFTSERRSYDITWMVDGKKHTESVEYGSIPAFSGSVDKPATESKIYTFAGWDNLPVRVTGDAVYTAQYSEVDRLYDITWIVNGDTVTEQYKYLEKPIYKGTTDRESDGTYTYSFVGWSPQVAIVTEDATYEALYSSKKLVVDSSGNPLSAKEENVSYVIETNEKNIDITTLYDEALKNDYDIKVQADKYTLTINSLAISELSDRGITRVAVSTDGDEARFLLCDGTGAVIDGGVTALLEFECIDDTGAEMFLLIDDELVPLDVKNGRASLYLASGQSARIIKKYSASVTSSEHGEVMLSEVQTEAGTDILINPVRAEYGYIIKEVKITSVLSGEPVEYDAETMTFKMPVGGAAVEVVFERQTFRVTFVSDGRVISEKTYFLGDEVELPEAPQREPAGDIIYSFSGWTPEIVTVAGDVEYTAVFTETRLADEEEMNEHNFKSRDYIWLIRFGAVGAAIAVIVIICRKRKKKRHGKKHKNNGTGE